MKLLLKKIDKIYDKNSTNQLGMMLNQYKINNKSKNLTYNPNNNYVVVIAVIFNCRMLQKMFKIINFNFTNNLNNNQITINL